MFVEQVHSIYDGAAGYQNIAEEYYDKYFHPTCFNFNRLSRLYIASRFPIRWDEQPLVEVGAGDSAIASLLHARGYSLMGVWITDASAAMLAHSAKWRDQGAQLAICAAHALSAKNESFSYLVASLGDPYNTSEFWQEARRVLRPNGQMIFTTPSFAWSSRFRDQGGAHSAKFIVHGEHCITLPSFIVSLQSQIQMMEAAGFSVTHYESLGVDRLHPSEPISPKLAVFDGETSSAVWGFEVVRRP